MRAHDKGRLAQRVRSALCAICLTGAIAVMLTAAAGAASHGAAGSSPMAVTKAAVNQALQIFRDHKTPLPERRRRLRDLLAKHFDFTEMARSALGTHWRGLSGDQRKQFVNLYTAYIEYNFLNKIQIYRELSFQFLKTIPTAKGYAQVNTRVEQPGQKPAALDFALKREDGGWKVTDVTINGLSMVGGDRTQFGMVIDNIGLDALMSDLRNRRAQLESSLK